MPGIKIYSPLQSLLYEISQGDKKRCGATLHNTLFTDCSGQRVYLPPDSDSAGKLALIKGMVTLRTA